MRKLVLLLGIFGLLPATARAEDAPNQCVAVIGNSDVHGAIETHSFPVSDKPKAKRMHHGGIIVQARYLEILRERYRKRMVLVDGGDLYQGTMASNLSHGAAIIDAYNLMGLDAAAIGNHEFDYGPLTPDHPNRLGHLDDRVKQAKFPFLSVNIFDKEDHQPHDWPQGTPSAQRSVLVDKDGIKVGIIGASTVETPKVTRAENVAHLNFPNPVPYIIAESVSLRAKGAQVVVLTAHIGSRCFNLDDPHNHRSCKQNAELFRLLNALPEGTIDVAVGGHTHAYVSHWVNGVAAIQAGARGQSLAWVDVCLGKDGKMDRKKSRIHQPVSMCLYEWEDGGGCRKRGEHDSPNRAMVQARFLGKPVYQHKEMRALMQPYLDKVKEVKSAKVGVYLSEPLRREQNLGDLVAESLRLSGEAEFALQNLGGVRADIKAGLITYGDIYEVLPFDNKVAVMQMKGALLEEFVGHIVKRRQKDPPYLAGLKVEFTGTGHRLLTADGNRLDPDRTYRLATNDFLVGGGEGIGALIAKLPKNAITVTDIDMREALIALLKKRFPARDS